MREWSLFGSRLAGPSGIGELMEDLGHALAGAHGRVCMLGGGNPAMIPEVMEIWRRRMAELIQAGDPFDRMLGHYDPPKGNSRFALALAGLMQREFGWDIGAEHIAITNGGQTAFFYLFNLLCGRRGDGTVRRVLFPLMPEYIGYANQGVTEGQFAAAAPKIAFTGPHRFKYHIDFDKLEMGGDIGAICVSRPTNPSGNVLTDAEVQRLDSLARAASVPLIIDNAYGAPFPGILFRHAHPVWNENIILTLSLSKLGLPGTRTGVVIAEPRIIRAITSMNAIIGLANGNIGQALVLPLLESGEILKIASEIIRPYYERKSEHAQEWIKAHFPDGIDYHVHETEGALFFWIWLRGLPISARELYERLKRRGVLVVPGNYFSFGCDETERHCSECIRVSFAMDDATVEEGIEIIGEEAARAYTG